MVEGQIRSASHLENWGDVCAQSERFNAKKEKEKSSSDNNAW